MSSLLLLPRLLILSLLTNIAFSQQAQQPLVSSSLLLPTLNQQSLSSHAISFSTFASQSPSKDRAIGTEGHKLSLSYIRQKLGDTGYYDISEQNFNIAVSRGTASLDIGGKKYDGFTMTHSPSGKVSAAVVAVAGYGCGPTNYRELEKMKGAIALIKWGGCQFGEQVARAGAAGAKGVIIYGGMPINKDQERAITLTLAERKEIGPYVPVIGVDEKYGAELLAAAKDKKIVNIDVQVKNQWITTTNVIAETKGGAKDKVVAIGTHTDTVPGSPGINDNVSGAGAALEIALQLSKFSVNNAVRFLFFSGEENEMVGSDYYMASLDEKSRKNFALYLNVDILASKNYGYFVYDGSSKKVPVPPGSRHVQDVFDKYFQSVGIKSLPIYTEEPRGDYKAFMTQNIPIGGIHSGADFPKSEEQAKIWGGQAGEPFDKNYHQPGDTIENIDLSVWLNHTKALGHAIATFSRDVSGVPKLKEGQKLPLRKLKIRGVENRHPQFVKA